MEMAELGFRIKEERKRKNAIILAHFFQMPEIQDIADFTGDTLGMIRFAANVDSDVIVVCGVDFMAESVKIMNPKKKVILPDPEARCPMARMVEVETLEWLKEDHPGAAVVSYIKSPASIKALSDICVTSSNAVRLIGSLENDKIIFIPDSDLGSYIKRFVKDKELILWPGCCPPLHKMSVDDIIPIKEKHPDAQIIVHPGSVSEVIDLADHVLSTKGIIDHVKLSPEREFIIGSERELCHRLRKDNPGKTFYPMERTFCPNMKRITLEKVLQGLEELEPEVALPEDLIEKARVPMERMMKLDDEQ